jgi:CheY-like chemotaxis protein
MLDAVARIQSILGPERAVDLVLPAKPLHVSGDRKLLALFLEEATRLALHALPPEGRLALMAGPALPGRTVELSLLFGSADFPPELHDRFFEPFAGTKEPGADPPLGLAALARALPGLGAAARLEGEPGEDPRLVLRLAQSVAAVQALAVGGMSYTILLVDDESVIRSLVRKALEREGYRVLEAQSTSAALRLAEEYPGPLDLLITDVDLPEAGGVALAGGFRKMRPSTPVLFITGHPADLPAEVNYLKKPFPVPELVERVRRILHGQAGSATAGTY